MKIKTSWFFFFLSMFTLLPLRVYHRIFTLDIQVGFSKKGDITLDILLGLMVVFAILISWLCATDKKTPGVYLEKPNFVAGLFAFLLTASVVVESVSRLVGISTDDVLKTSKIILSIAGFIAAIAFLILSIDAFRGTNTFGRRPYLSLVLPLWGLVRLTVNFIQFNTETGQENMFDSFAMIAGLLFLYSQSRLFVGIERKKTLRSTFSFGFFAIVTGFMAMLPRYLGYALINYYPVQGVTEQIYPHGLTPFPTDLIFALYVFAFLVGLYFQSYKKGMALEAKDGHTPAMPNELLHEKAPDASSSYLDSVADRPEQAAPSLSPPDSSPYPVDQNNLYPPISTTESYYAGGSTYAGNIPPYQNTPQGNPYYSGQNDGYGQPPAPPNDYNYTTNPYYSSQGNKQPPYDPNRQNEYYSPQPPAPDHGQPQPYSNYPR